MSRIHVAAALATAVLLTSPAFGQSSTAGGDKPQFITQQSENHWRASKLVGLNVYGANDEKIGDIREVLMEKNNGNADAVVIGVGGFLGIGQKDVAIPFKSLKWVSHEAAAAKQASRAPATTGGPAGAGGAANRPAGGAMAARDTQDTDATRGYPAHAELAMTKDELKNAPDFYYAGSKPKQQ